MSAEAVQGQLIDLADYQRSLTVEEAYEAQIATEVDCFEQRLRERSCAIAAERGEYQPTARMAFDASGQLYLATVAAPSTDHVSALGGVFLGGGMSGLITLLAGAESLPLTLGTVAATASGVALVSNPGGGRYLVRRLLGRS
jgi:hypothetical protein